MALKQDLESIFVPILKKEIEKEILNQGHRDTGKLTDDAEIFVKEVNNAMHVLGYYEHYARDVEQGVSAEAIAKVKFAPAAISALTKWARRKRFENPRGAAYAIRQKQSKEGMPTRGSYRFSKNGRRRDAFDVALNSKTVTDTLDQVVGKSIEKTIDNLIARNK